MGSDDIVRAEVEGAKDVEGHFAIKAESLESDGVDYIAILVQGTDLEIRL